MMKVEGRVERLLLLPFSLGCDSQSSIAIAANSLPKAGGKGGDGDKLASKKKITKKKKKKKNWKASLSQGFHRFIEQIKSFSQLLVYKGENEKQEKMEKGEEKEMEIGFPTDVMHLTHIGWDGSCTTMNNTSSDEHHQMLSTVTFQQFQMAMVAQSQSYSHQSLQLNTTDDT